MECHEDVVAGVLGQYLPQRLGRVRAAQGLGPVGPQGRFRLTDRYRYVDVQLIFADTLC